MFNSQDETSWIKEDISTSGKEWYPSKARGSSHGVGKESSDDNSDFEDHVVGISAKIEKKRDTKKSLVPATSQSKEPQSIAPTLRTKLFNKFKPLQATGTQRKPLCNITSGTKPSKDDSSGSDSDGSVNNYLVNPEELDLRSSFFDVTAAKKRSGTASVSQFHCNTGASLSHSDSDAENNEEGDLSGEHEPKNTFDFNNLLDNASSLELAKENYAKEQENTTTRNANETSAHDVQSLLALGEANIEMAVDEQSSKKSCGSSDKKHVNESKIRSQREEESITTFQCEDSDWEEVADELCEENNKLDLKTSANNRAAAPITDLEICVELPEKHSSKRNQKEIDVEATIRRQLNREIKENQIKLHKESLQACFDGCISLNELCNNTILREAILTLLPSKNVFPSERTDIEYYKSLVTWFKTHNTLNSDQMYGDLEAISQEKLSVLVQSEIKSRQASCKQNFILIFIIFVRAMGLQCRLVVNLLPLPLRPPQSELCSVKNNSGKNSLNKSVSKHEKSEISKPCTIKKSKEQPAASTKDTKSITKTKEETKLSKEGYTLSTPKHQSPSSAKLAAKIREMSKRLPPKSQVENQVNDLLFDTNSEEEETQSQKLKSSLKPARKLREMAKTLLSGSQVKENKCGDLLIKPNSEIAQYNTQKLKSRSKSQTKEVIGISKKLENDKAKLQMKCSSVSVQTPSQKLASKLLYESDKLKKQNPATKLREMSKRAKSKTETFESKETAIAAVTDDDPLDVKSTCHQQLTHKISKFDAPLEEALFAMSESNTNVEKEASATKRSAITNSQEVPSEPPVKFKYESKLFKLSLATPIARRLRSAEKPKLNQIPIKNEEKLSEKSVNPNALIQPESEKQKNTANRRSRMYSSKMRSSTKFNKCSSELSQIQVSTISMRTRSRNKSSNNVESSSNGTRDSFMSKISKEHNNSGHHLTIPQLDGANDSLVKEPSSRSLKTSSLSRQQTKAKDSDDDFEPSPPKRIKKAPMKVNERLKKDQRKLSIDYNNGGSDESFNKNKLTVDMWSEVWSDVELKWVCIDLFKGKVDCVDSIIEAANKSSDLAYVYAFQNNSTVKDVTARYCPNWCDTMRKGRVEQSWLDETFGKYYSTIKSKREILEDEELHKIQIEKPMPKTISEYKDHPLYALERHLLQFQAMYPPNAPTLGFIRGEPVYARDCVHTLHAREVWLKEARVVKLNEQPYKIVKRPKWDKLKNQIIKDQPVEIFGYWQTEEYEPPTAENGIVPRNAYGNVDLFKASMLPKNTVHLQLPGLSRICKKLGIDCAQAVIGFDFPHGFCHARYDGFVVCEEYRDQVIAAWNQDQEEVKRKEQEKYEARVYGNWKKCIRGLLIRERLKLKYNF